MDRPTTKVSFALDLELHEAVTALKRKTPGSNQTTILNDLIAAGLKARSDGVRLRNREDYLLVKMIFMLRYVLGTRGQEFLEKIDSEFAEEFESIRDMILNEGMDYGGR